MQGNDDWYLQYIPIRDRVADLEQNAEAHLRVKPVVRDAFASQNIQTNVVIPDIPFPTIVKVSSYGIQ